MNVRCAASPRLSLRLIFFACASIAFSTSAFALTGRVVNKTLNRPEKGVTVSYVQHVNNNVTVLRDTTDAEGRFTIDATVDTSANPPSMLFARYADIDYPAEPAAGPVEIPVFETTTADSAISVVSHHILINAQTRDVTYILIAHNRGNLTYISDKDHGHGLEIPLPAEVTNLAQAPEGVHLHGNTVVDPRPVVPGNSQTFFTFALPGSNRIVQHITYPTGAVDVLVQPSDADLTVNGLEDQGTVSLGQQTFRRFTAMNLAPGSHIELTLGSGQWLSQKALIWALVVLALAFGGTAVVVARRPRGQKSPKPVGDRRSALLEQIADLDDRFERGDIAKADYRTRRDAFKAEVAELSGAGAPGGTSKADADESRGALLEQIADLDDRFERGDIAKADYDKQRNALKAQVAARAKQRRPR